jgi:hypothetical protein
MQEQIREEDFMVFNSSRVTHLARLAICPSGFGKRWYLPD